MEKTKKGSKRETYCANARPEAFPTEWNRSKEVHLGVAVGGLSKASPPDDDPSLLLRLDG